MWPTRPPPSASLRRSLLQRRRCSQGPSADAAEGSETDESDISGMTELATLRRAEAGPSSNAGASLPTFFRPRPRPGSLRARCEAAVRAMWLEDHADAVLSQEELESIWFWLKEASSDAGADQEMLSYEGFCRVTDRFQETFGARARRRVHGFLRASTFLRLAKDDRGRISALSLFELLMRQCFTARLRLDLAKYGDARRCRCPCVMRAPPGLPQRSCHGQSGVRLGATRTMHCSQTPTETGS